MFMVVHQPGAWYEQEVGVQTLQLQVYDVAGCWQDIPPHEHLLLFEAPAPLLVPWGLVAGGLSLALNRIMA